MRKFLFGFITHQVISRKIFPKIQFYSIVVSSMEQLNFTEYELIQQQTFWTSSVDRVLWRTLGVKRHITLIFVISNTCHMWFTPYHLWNEYNKNNMSCLPQNHTAPLAWEYCKNETFLWTIHHRLGCPFFIINTYSSICKVLLPFYPHSSEPGMKHLVYKIYQVEVLHLNTHELPKQQNKFWLNRLRGHLSSQLIYTSIKKKKWGSSRSQRFTAWEEFNRPLLVWTWREL